MRTFKRILVFILFTMALIGAVGGLKYKKVYAVNYAPVFTEDFESYTATTSYQGTPSYAFTGGSWAVNNGCVSKTDYITGTKSLHMRWYGNSSDVYPSLELTFSSAKTVDILEFNYAVSNKNVHFRVSYSSDGSSYTQINEDVLPANTDKNSFSKEYATSISLLKLKIEAISGGTAPGKDKNYTFRIDDVVLSAETSAPQLSSPANAAIAGTTLSFNAVTHASSYNVGFFENEADDSPSKVVNINTTSYTFTQQSTDGNNYIKIQTLGDGVNYLNSDYSNVGTYTYTDIPVKTIAQVSGFENETAEPYSYYDITGTVKSIANGDSPNIYITDGENDLYVYGLAETKGGSPRNASSLGIEVGFTVRIKAYKTIYNTTVELKGYLVSATPNYGMQFAQLNTAASLKVDYTSNMANALADSTASITKPGDTIDTAENVSFASELKLDPRLFRVTFTKNEAQNLVKLYNTDIRLYYKSNGNGNTMTITGQSGIKISKLEITYTTDGYKEATVTGESNVTSVVDGENSLKYIYTFASNSSYADIKCTSTSAQARISALTIYYSGSYASSYTINTETVAAEEKPLLSLMFGSRFTNELKENLDASGNTVTYGIAYSKTEDLTGASKSLAEALDAGDSFVHTVEGTPVKVDADGTANESGDYSQIGVSLNHIPETSYATEITAAVYVCVDGTYYLMNTKAYSIKSIALAYRTSDCTGYEEHLGLLGYLASYGD